MLSSRLIRGSRFILMPPSEPVAAEFHNPVARYLAATRAPFLSVTAVSCLIGLGTAFASRGFLDLTAAVVTMLFALVAHAGVNVLNDYYDDRNGTDRLNTDRIYPFTGGSRLIQNGVLTATQMLRFGLALFLAVMTAGLWLAARSAAGLVWIGIAGLLIGWAYSAPPLRLNSRGLGEACVAVGFGLIAAGADFVQRSAFAGLPWLAVFGYSLLVTNILYINQFPDRVADEAAGKRHWVVRLGAERGRWLYLGIAGLAYGGLAVLALGGWLPRLTLIGVLAAPLSLSAARILLANAGRPRALEPAVKMTIAAANVSGILVAVALFLG